MTDTQTRETVYYRPAVAAPTHQGLYGQWLELAELVAGGLRRPEAIAEAMGLSLRETQVLIAEMDHWLMIHTNMGKRIQLSRKGRARMEEAQQARAEEFS